jgi:predicted GNAT superfamily acetyltransferase
LGAISTSFEIDRYGSDFAPGLYGGMPSDRLHIIWDITSPAAMERLLGLDDQAPIPALLVAPHAPGTAQEIARIDIPADIDSLISASPEEALEWRLRVRDALVAAFSEGFAITGFQSARSGGRPALILERLPPEKS